MKKTNEEQEIGFNGPDEEAKESQSTKQAEKECKHEGECFGACNEKKDLPYMHEHDTVKSRLTGKDVEISMPPSGNGMVSKNPFVSLAQEGFLHAHPEKLGAKKLAEFDRETKGMKLPKKVKK
jgi:hypothetical protein